MKFLRLVPKYKEICCVNMSRKYADLPEQGKLTKLCSNAGFSKSIEKGQFFITLDKNCWIMSRVFFAHTLLRSDQASQVKGWIRGNTKIGPGLEVKVCYRRDRTCSWVRIVNGINKYVPETSEEILVASVVRGVHGNLLRRLDHDRHRP